MNDIPLEHFKKAFEGLDPLIARHVTDNRIPLLMLAAQTPDGSALNRVYSGDGKCFTPLQNEAPLHGVGSLSKAIAAAALCKLAEQGRIRLDTPFLTFFPEWVVSRQSPLYRTTLINLARHQSILAVKQENRHFRQIEQTSVPRSAPSSEHLIRILKGGKVIAQKDREAVDYTCRGIALIGEIIERVTGVRYEDFVNRYLLRPHGLRDIFPAVSAMTSSDKRRIVSGNYLDWRTREPMKVKQTDEGALNPGRGCVSNASAMAIFFHHLLSGKILSPHYTKLMIEETALLGKPDKEILGKQALYSLGLTHSQFDDQHLERRLIGHNGLASGCLSHVGWYAPLNLTICATVNFLRLPPDEQHSYETVGAPHKLVAHIFRTLNSITEELYQNKGFEALLTRSDPLPPVRNQVMPPTAHAVAHLLARARLQQQTSEASMAKTPLIETPALQTSSKTETPARCRRPVGISNISPARCKL